MMKRRITQTGESEQRGAFEALLNSRPESNDQSKSDTVLVVIGIGLSLYLFAFSVLFAAVSALFQCSLGS